MRLLFLLLMIALLPLRSWAVVGMSTAQAIDQIATENEAHNDQNTWARGTFSLNDTTNHGNCHEAAEVEKVAFTATHTTTDTPQPTPTHHSCAHCTACGLCHLGLAVLGLVAEPHGAQSAAPPASPGHHFASVTSTPSLKPPIG